MTAAALLKDGSGANNISTTVYSGSDDSLLSISCMVREFLRQNHSGLIDLGDSRIALTGASLRYLSQLAAWSCDSSTLAVSSSRQSEPKGGSNNDFEEHVKTQRFIDGSS